MGHQWTNSRGSNHHQRRQHRRSSRVPDSDYGYTVPGLSPDVSDSEFDSFSDDGVDSATRGNRGWNVSSSPNLDAIVQSSSTILRDNLQYVINLQSEKLSSLVERETSEIRAIIDRQNRDITHLCNMVEKIAAWAGAHATAELASDIVPYREISNLTASAQQHVAAVAAVQKATAQVQRQQQEQDRVVSPTETVSPATRHRPQPMLVTRNSVQQNGYTLNGTATSKLTDDYRTAEDAVLDDAAEMYAASQVQAAEVNLFKVAAVAAAAAHQQQSQPQQQQPHQQPQQPQQSQPQQQPQQQQQQHNGALQGTRTTQHISLSQSSPVTGPTSPDVRRQNKAPTQAQQHHIQHQHDANPYMLNVQHATARPVSPPGNSSGMEQLVVPRYRMSREVTTVPELWQEWMHGLNGGPKVRELEEKYGTRWRSSSAERKFFCLRKVILDYIHRIGEIQGISREDAVLQVEAIRKQHGYTSLQRLSEFLKKQRIK
ncbi:transcriptional activator of glycolytic enzymes-domain-containing protein [Kockiozyma suomiensis]|uniref:transcriptional activator of glycolytic enzymes-domain-containing protein n=1 Tax=Kockiozyma suomiensis TaxID=1337062 RepID=UPI003343ECB6